MASSTSFESTEWILGELESLARAGDPDNLFYGRLLRALQTVLRSDSVFLGVQVGEDPVLLDRIGSQYPDSLLLDCLRKIFRTDSRRAGHAVGRQQEVESVPGVRGVLLNGTCSDLEGNQGDGCWFAIRFPRLAVVVWFDHPLPSSQEQGVRNLLRAFSEVCEVREVYVENARSIGSWKQVNQRARELGQSQSSSQLNRGLVESIRESLGADRVAMFQSVDGSIAMVACTGSSVIDSQSVTVRELESLVAAEVKANRPKFWSQAVETFDGVKPSQGEKDTQEAEFCDHRYFLFLPWQSPSSVPTEWVLAEWSESQGILDRVQRSVDILPILNGAWQSQTRWLQVPDRIKAEVESKKSISGRRTIGSKWTLGVVASVAAFLLGMIPIPFRIHAEANLEPVTQRYIHATADCFIDTLYVREGDSVQRGQPLVQLRSPNLEIRIEDAVGQLRAIEEKRNGLRVAVNQMSINPGDLANQTRITSELQLVEIQEEHAREKLRFLEQEKAELLLSAPIAGMIVANDLDRELRDRPLQRGDALFRIADLDGEWQLRLFISDRDGGYVQDQLQSASVPIDWGLENGAGQVFRGSLQELSLDVDHRPMKGAYRIGIASLDSKQIDHPVIGSVAYARIPCGYQPLWFVWSRPLVEFLQKRFWLTGTTLSLAHELARNPK